MAWSRESRHERGYDAAWVSATKRILKRDNYLCQECMRQGRLTPLKVRPRDHAVDHITPKARGGTDDDDNLQSLCADCHSDKTATEAAEAQGRDIRPRIEFSRDGRVVW